MEQALRVRGPSPTQSNGSALAAPGGKRTQSRGRLVAAVTGLVVLALAWLVFDSLVPAAPRSRPLLAATVSIPAGQVITQGDIQVVTVASSGFAGIPSSSATLVVGRRAGLDIGPGQLLVQADVGGTAGPAAGESVVGLALPDGRFPVGLSAGDSVVVVDTPPAAGGTDAAAGTAPMELAAGRVLTVGRSSDGSSTLVSLVVPAAGANGVTLASAADSVSLVWVTH